jgi:hypothetical protein
MHLAWNKQPVIISQYTWDWCQVSGSGSELGVSLVNIRACTVFRTLSCEHITLCSMDSVNRTGNYRICHSKEAEKLFIPTSAFTQTMTSQDTHMGNMT